MSRGLALHRQTRSRPRSNGCTCPISDLETGSTVRSSRPHPSSTARPWTGRFNRRMIRSGPWSAAMDVGGWLRGLGLGQYEALFRASEIDADILPELTDA